MDLQIGYNLEPDWNFCNYKQSVLEFCKYRNQILAPQDFYCLLPVFGLYTSCGSGIVLLFPELDLVELRKGTNDWTCLPDLPSSPGKDPMCVDNKQGMLWMQAYMTKSTPSLSQNGLVYMLAGGSDASNTDPFATGPTEGEDWITTGAHTMILPAGDLDENVYGTDPKKGGPWIMWSGTPYEHLMVPVK